MAEIIWTEPALSDLNEIAEYIALENPLAARGLVQRVFSAIERLERQPASGKAPAELGVNRYREMIGGPCRVFCRYSKKQVFILYVLRSERELRNFVLEDRDDRGNQQVMAGGRCASQL